MCRFILEYIKFNIDYLFIAIDLLSFFSSIEQEKKKQSTKSSTVSWSHLRIDFNCTSNLIKDYPRIFFADFHSSKSRESHADFTSIGD